MAQKRVIPARIRSGAGKLRDSRLIVIAAEGRKTEKKYFEDLAALYHNTKIKVHVLEGLDNRSSPNHVLERLDAFKDEYSLEEDDMLWLVSDVDRWGEEKLSDIAQKCNQKGFFLAISNPSFEVRLLLHLRDLDDFSSAEQQELFENRRDRTSRSRLEREIIGILQRYNKSNLNTSDFLPYVDLAVKRARRLDCNVGHRWPNGLGTRVYLLVEEILGEKNLISEHES